MSERSYSQKCEKCGEFFVTRVVDPKTICEKCFLIIKIQERIRDLIQKHPYMAYGREMLVLLDEIERKIRGISLVVLGYPFSENKGKLQVYFENELTHIQSIKQKCRFQI